MGTFLARLYWVWMSQAGMYEIEAKTVSNNFVKNILFNNRNKYFFL